MNRRDLVAELDDHISEEHHRITQMAARMEQMQSQMEKIATAQEGMLKSFEQARGALTFIKWMSAIVVAGAAVYGWVVSNLNVHMK